MRIAFSRRHLTAGLAAAATTATVVCTGTGVAHADITSPAANGGVFNVFTEPDSFTGDPANKLAAGGWWGHEGPGRSVAGTTFSLDAMTTGATAAILSAFQVTDPSTQIGVAFVPTSASGTANERPTVTAGELAGEAFDWFIDAPVTAPIVGDNFGDGVTIAHTQTMWNNWVADSTPNELLENKSTSGGNDLEVHNPLRTGDPLSTAPSGKSILNTWPAGTEISMVYYAIDHLDAHQEPVVKVGSDGRAITAWRTFTTVADPTRPAATSAGYQYTDLVVDHTSTTLSVTPPSPGTAPATVSLNATVTDTTDGTKTPTGTVEYFDGITSLGSAAVGTAVSAPLSVGTHPLKAVFTPADPTTFGNSTSSVSSYVVNGIATTATLSAPSTATTGTAVTLTANVTPVGTAGSVAFKDGLSVIATVPVSTTTGEASTPWTPSTSGSHNLTAVFTPTDGNYATATSAPQAVAVSLGAGAFDSNVDADILDGSILVTTPYVNSATALHFNTVSLDANATMYTKTITFNHIKVSDTRAGDQDWSMTAIASNLVSDSDPTAIINGQNLGMTHVKQSADETGYVNTGSGAMHFHDHAAASAVAPGDAGSLGLKDPSQIANRDAQSTGTTVIEGDLTLNAPTNTKPGHYQGVITFTVS